MKKSPGHKQQDMKKIIAAELEDGDVVKFGGGVEGKGYHGEDGQNIGDEGEFAGQGLLICSVLIC